MSEASPFGDVGVSTIRILTVQAIPIGWIPTIEIYGGGHFVANVAAVHKENVQQTVIVVIEECYPSRHGFNQMLSRSWRVTENKINTLQGLHLEHWGGLGVSPLGVQHAAEFKRAKRKQQRQQLSSGHPRSWQFETAWRLQLATEKTPCAIEPRCSALSFSLRIPNFQATALDSSAIFRIGHGRVVPFEDNEGDGLTSAMCARAVLIRPLYSSSF